MHTDLAEHAVWRPPPPARRERRWLSLAVLAGSHLLIALDATIVNVALSTVAADLGFDAADLQWVVTAYTLAVGGFLLLGGRLADHYGRRRMFITGATAFALGSLLAGSATSPPVLIAGRAVQGLAAAVLVPSALSLLMVIFVEGPDRDRALGVWAAVAGGGTAAGLLLGGVLTQVLSWEWVFWINVPIAVGAALCARIVMPEHGGAGGEAFDVAGAFLGTTGLVVFVYALVRTPEVGWLSAPTLLFLTLAAALLTAFAWLQRVRANPLVPVRILRDRRVLGAGLVVLIFGAAIYALFYFLSIFMGGPLGYTPVQIGLAFLPMTAAMVTASWVAGNLQARFTPRSVIIAGTLLIAGGLAGLSRIAPDTGYAGTLLPALICVGIGMGLGLVALTSAGVGGVAEADSGIASGVFNAGQQVGGALGLALLTMVSATRTRHLAGDAMHPGPDAVTAGWSLGFLVAAGLMVLGTAVTAAMIGRHEKPAPPDADRRATADDSHASRPAPAAHTP